MCTTANKYQGKCTGMKKVTKYMTMYGILILVIILTVGASFFLFQEEPKESVPFETLLKRAGPKPSSVSASPGFSIITSESEWAALWSRLHILWETPPPLTFVNFSEEMVIAFFQGERGTGGYSVEIVEIYETDDSLVAVVKESKPGFGCGVTAVVSYSYHIVKMPITSKNVKYIIREEARVCI